MSGAKKRQTMAKQARERAVREKRALKQERKREAAHLRLAGETEAPAEPSDEATGEAAEPGLQLVADDPSADSEAPGEENELRGAHA